MRETISLYSNKLSILGSFQLCYTMRTYPMPIENALLIQQKNIVENCCCEGIIWSEWKDRGFQTQAQHVVSVLSSFFRKVTLLKIYTLVNPLNL